MYNECFVIIIHKIAFGITKSWRTRWAEHVAHTGEGKCLEYFVYKTFSKG